jgi:hypothetical protein
MSAAKAGETISNETAAAYDLSKEASPMAILRHEQTIFCICGQWLGHVFRAVFHLRLRCRNTAKVALIHEIGNFTELA